MRSSSRAISLESSRGQAQHLDSELLTLLGCRGRWRRATQQPGKLRTIGYLGSSTASAQSQYVAEHVSDERRGFYTGWPQTSPTLGIVVALAVVLATRGYFGDQAPFLVSFLLVAIAIYIRLQLGETPIFQEIKAKKLMTRNPWKEE